MPIILPPPIPPKFVSAVTQMDAEEEGVVIAAALAAKRILQKHGLTWRDIAPILLAAPEPVRAPPFSWQSKVALCQQHANLLTERERDFVRNARTLSRLTQKQECWLDAIYAKVAP